MVKRSAKVIFEYQAQESDELTLKIGDVVHDIEPADTGWCKGVVNGKTGMFPDNFVKFIEEKEKPPPVPAVSKKPSNKTKTKKMVKVLFPYEKGNDDELDLVMGETFTYLKEVEEGWGEGEKNGKTGVFPTNFVEIIVVDEDSSPAKEAVSSKVESEPPHEENKQSKKVKGIGLGNIFGNEPIKLRQMSIGETESKIVEKKIKVSNSSATAKQNKINKVDKEALKKEYCKAMFEYVAENEDELTLEKGEMITLISKTSCDDGWWEGEKKMPDGTMNKGVFPDNFVVLMTSEQVNEMLQEKESVSNQSSTDSYQEVSKSVKSPKPSKGPAPVMPSASSKPTQENDISLAPFDDIVTNHTDSKLTHVKRVGGPKNRRKPDADERRQKAKQAVEETHSQVGTESSDEEIVEAVKQSPASSAKAAKHGGVSVMPPSDSGDGPPAWLKNLQSRKSQKKPVTTPVDNTTSPVQQPVKSPGEAKKPDWMKNLRKKRESGNFELPASKPAATAPQKAQEKQEAKKPPAPKPNGSIQKEEQPPKAKEAIKPKEPIKPKEVAKPKEAPVQPKSPEEPEEKPLAPWQKQLKARKESSISTTPSASTDIINTNSAPPVPAWKQSIKKPVTDEPPKPISSVRTKPPPPRGKPALPGAKPIIATAVVDELKDEIKGLKNEIKNLTLHLEEEKQLRIKLQADVDILKVKLS